VVQRYSHNLQQLSTLLGLFVFQICLFFFGFFFFWSLGKFGSTNERKHIELDKVAKQ